MPQQTIDYQSRRASRGERHRAILSAALAAGVIVAMNAALLAAAVADRSWGALRIALVVGPVTNLLLSLAALACTPALKRASSGASVLPYILVCVVLPIIAIVVDLMIIWSMDLHGS